MSINESLFQSVCDHARQATVLQTVSETLEWDERTQMPHANGDYRAQQVAALETAAHRLRTDAKLGTDLQHLRAQLGDADPNCDQGATIIGLHRDWTRDCKLPADLVEKLARARVVGQQLWEKARAADDFSVFSEALANMVELKREAGKRMADGTDRTAYEALMDTYEPDARVDQLQKVFDDVRGPLVKLVADIKNAPKQPPVEILKRDYPIDSQRDFSRFVTEQIGFDYQRGRLDETAHPFCTTLGPNDIRILTRYVRDWLPSGLFGSLHEAGHGMYEQGLRTKDWFGLPPGSYASLGVHESQSRLWENQVGRSRPFWEWLYPHAQERFASQLGKVDLDDFHFAINSVKPSLIRVEADEVTYNLHILIRFDLERQLIDGNLTVEELPRAWGDRYQSDLGVQPPSDANGVLQDVHWSAGLFGYFPTYTLGNLIGAQLYHAAEKNLGSFEGLFRNGDFAPLLGWLGENVFAGGRCFSGDQIVERATGEKLSAKYLIDYLRSKLSPLYQLN